jgi:hypothetical protein
MVSKVEFKILNYKSEEGSYVKLDYTCRGCQRKSFDPALDLDSGLLRVIDGNEIISEHSFYGPFTENHVQTLRDVLVDLKSDKSSAVELDLRLGHALERLYPAETGGPFMISDAMD